MKAWWKRQSARIDALGLRERATLFVSILVVCVALVDSLLISPAQLVYKQRSERHAAQAIELARLQEEVRNSFGQADPVRQIKGDLSAADAQLETINQQILTLAPAAADHPPLEQVLVQFLRRQPGLTLVEATTLAASTSKAGSEVVPGMERRGVTLRVAGSYAELTAYVASLEKALPQLRWGVLELRGESGKKAELRLQVHVVGVLP